MCDIILFLPIFRLDSVYGCYKGFLPPHRNERYHLQDFRHGWSRPMNVVELFNYRHSSLWLAVERTFRVWKARFPIFDDMHSYSIANQWLFVVACCTMLNFIRKNCSANDPLFSVALKKHYGKDWIDASQLPTMPDVPYVLHRQPPDQTLQSKEIMIIVWEAMTKHLWKTINDD